MSDDALEADIDADKSNAALGGAIYCLLNVIEMLTKLTRIGESVLAGRRNTSIESVSCATHT